MSNTKTATNAAAAKQAAHTPGPWRTYFNDYSGILPGWRGWQVKTDDEIQTPIAIVPEPQGGKKVRSRSPWQEANAHLIAAAPELLAALKNLMAEFRVLERCIPCKLPGDDPAYTAAKAAIAKATEGSAQ